MLTNGQFFSSFVFTLCVIGILVALAGIVFVAIRVWQLSQPLRERLRRSWVARRIRAIGTILGFTVVHVKSFMKSPLAVPVVRPWRAFIALSIALGNLLRQVPWGICVGVLVACPLPFLVFATVSMPLKSIIGIATAGALIGMFCAPFTSWYYRRLGASRALGVSLLTIVGGAWGSSMLIATLIAMVLG